VEDQLVIHRDNHVQLVESALLVAEVDLDEVDHRLLDELRLEGVAHGFLQILNDDTSQQSLLAC
jgi:hypothetical protein